MPTFKRRTLLFPRGCTTDSRLLSRLAESDERAWREFDEKYRNMICAIGGKMGVPPADHDDLVQEVMLVCCRRLETFFYDRTKGRFRSYISAIIRNVSWVLLRKKRSVPPENLPEYDDSVDLHFMEQYENFLLETVLKHLRERVSTQTYSAFEMLCIQQLPPEEVSRITRKSLPTLYLIRHRCIRILRKCITEIPEAAERLHSKGSSSSRA
ncbi:MAG: sigma-70 family RNA polymerase sigma factor [Lentisphaeria bacterium]|nr:sigma-70 family RNA polymerase sigma factor [Lentisphaeria bacterium]